MALPSAPRCLAASIFALVASLGGAGCGGGSGDEAGAEDARPRDALARADAFGADRIEVADAGTIDAFEGDVIEGDALEGDAVATDAPEGDALVGDALAADAEAADALPADALAGDALPADALPADALAADALLSDALPSDARLADALPSDALPSDALPRDALPADALPADASAADAVPADAAPLDSGAPADTGVIDSGAPDSGVFGTGRCAGKPCLTAIRDAAEWAFVSGPSTPGARCDLDEEAIYLMPRSAGAAIQETLYVDVKRHRLLLDFLRIEFSALFGALDADQYLERFEDMTTREYFTGRLFRKTGAGVPSYGFDITAPAGGWGDPLTQADVESVYQKLTATFSLPLAYTPQHPRAVENAAQFVRPPFQVHLYSLCPNEDCPRGARPCLVIPQGAKACGNFQDNRTIQVEYERLARLDFVPGAIELPTAPGGMSINLVSGGELGPSRTPLVPVGAGRLTATDFGGTIYYTYTHRMTAGTDAMPITWDIWLDGDRTLVLRSPRDESLFIHGTINGGQTVDEVVRFSSCDHLGIDRYFAEGQTQEGLRFRLEYRHAVPAAGSGPLALMRADVVVPGGSQTVTDPFRLVYAGVHHNWDNQFWVLLEPPLVLSGHPIHGLWVDEASTRCCPVDNIHTLDTRQQILDTLRVSSYVRAPILF